MSTTTETQVDPGEQTQNTPDPTTAEPVDTGEAPNPDIVTPEPTEATESQTTDTRDERDKALARMERRINKKHAEAAAANERARILEERLKEFETRAKDDPDTSTTTQQQPPVDPVLLARYISAVDKITEKSNAIAAAGKKRFGGDFDAALATVNEEVGPLFDRGLPLPVGAAVLESDDPAALLHYLGKNPETAAELAHLSPTQLGRRIERIEAQMKAAPKTSGAPKPLTPVKPTAAAPAVDESKLTDKQWYEARRKARLSA